MLAIREQALKKLEEARNRKVINAGLEAKLRMLASGKTLDLLKTYAPSLPELFIVSQVSVEPSDGKTGSSTAGPVDSIEVPRADGKKCERCWNFSVRVGENADYPNICERCTAAIAEIENSRDAAVESANR